MKKKIFSGALLVLMIAALMLTTTGCGSEVEADDSAARIAQLEAENASLKAQVEELTAQLNQTPQTAALQDWTLNASAWADGNGATVTFTATPDSYAEGMRAALSVRIGDLEAESTNCVWDGSAFTGSVELSAADGYSYYCVLTGADGTQSEVALNTPDAVTDEALIDLGSYLASYANLVVEDWEATAASLNIKSGYAQVQMPRLTFEGTAVSATGAHLVLQLNGEEVGRQEIALTQGEGSGSYECSISSISFNMPAMEEDYQLDLWLEVSLSSGSHVSVNGGSWYNDSGDLQLVVG